MGEKARLAFEKWTILLILSETIGKDLLGKSEQSGFRSSRHNSDSDSEQEDFRKGREKSLSHGTERRIRDKIEKMESTVKKRNLMARWHPAHHVSRANADERGDSDENESGKSSV